jgi:hypothetical protein
MSQPSDNGVRALERLRGTLERIGGTLEQLLLLMRADAIARTQLRASRRKRRDTATRSTRKGAP